MRQEIDGSPVKGILDLSELNEEDRIRVMDQIKERQPTAKLDPNFKVTVTDDGGLMGRLSGAVWSVRLLPKES